VGPGADAFEFDHFQSGKRAFSFAGHFRSVVFRFSLRRLHRSIARHHFERLKKCAVLYEVRAFLLQIRGDISAVIPPYRKLCRDEFAG
jgi:hypothetical protein